MSKGLVIIVIIMCLCGMGSCVDEALVILQETSPALFYEDGGLAQEEGTESSEAATESATAQETFINAENVSESETSESAELQYEERIDAQILAKYPDKHGWMENCDCGDIPYLANAGYIDKSLKDGIFLVSTPEELASFNYYVNAVSDDGANQYMQLMNDIDLSGYEWAPMGWSGGTDTGVSFSGGIYGEGYTIRNLYIETDEQSAGFIGWGVYCGVWNLTLEDAYVKGRMYVGILTGQAIRGWYENCHVSGEVYGDDAGSLHGHSTSNDIYDCTADVTVNGEAFEFLTYNEKAISEIVIENPIVIVLHDDYSITRTQGEDFTNLGWQVKKDGRIVVERDSPKETYCYSDQSPGTYEICLTAFVEGQYVPVSNIVEYTIE